MVRVARARALCRAVETAPPGCYRRRYLHLKRPKWNMAVAIFASWGIAFAEYCMQVPANRIGHVSNGGPFSAPVLKVIQELLSLSAFAVFSTYVLQEKLRWTDGLGFVLIVAGVVTAMAGREAAARREARAYESLAPPELQLAPPPPQGANTG